MALLTNINDLFTVDSTGAISFNRVDGSTTTGYTFPATDGTDGYVLKTNGDGVLDWAPDSNTGTVTGTGVANKVAYWTSATNIDDGPITFATNDSTFGGDVDVNGKLDVTSTASDAVFLRSSQATTTNVYITNTNATANNTANLYFAPANNIGGAYIRSTAIEDFSSSANRTSDLRFAVRKDGTFNEAVIIDSSGDLTIEGGRIYVKESDLGNNAVAITRDADEGYVQLFSSGSQTIEIRGNGNSYFNGGNVGIGTDSPNAKLEIASGQAKTVTSGVEFARFGTSNEASNYATLTCEVKGGAAAANRKWIFQTIEAGVANAGNIVFQPSGGNVGIGTDSPGAKLDIFGSGNTAINTKGNLFVSSGGTAAQAAETGGQISFGSWLNGDLSAPYPLAAIRGVAESSTTNVNKGALVFGTMDSNTSVQERMRIDGNGSVGINQTSPIFYLHSNNVVTIPNSRYLNFNGSGDTEIGQANFKQALVCSFNDSTATSQPKNIGIILHNDSTQDNNFTPMLGFGALSNSSQFSQVVAGIAGKRLGTAASDTNWSAGELWFWTGRTTATGLSAQNPAMVMDSYSNVGIGTTSPSEILQTNKNSAGNIVGGYFTNSQANTGAESVSLAFGLNRSGGDFVRQVKAITFGAEQQWTGTPSTVDGYLSFSTVSNETVSERMRINATGNVLIGNPSVNHGYKLQIEGNDIMLNTENSIQGKSIYARYSSQFTIQCDSELRFSTGGSPTQKMVIQAGGNVGIGTTGPEHKLVVIGTIGFGLNYNGGVYANDTVTGVDENWGLEVQRTANVNDYNTRLKYYPASGESRAAGIYDSRNARFSLYSDTNNNPNIIIPNGNVGIGTTNPSGKLEIGTAGATAKPDALRISNASDYAYYWDIWRDNTTGYLNFGSATGGSLTTQVTIKDVSGSVGIGDTTPSYKLDVDGTIRATGDVIAYSDERVKENIKTIDNSLEKVSKLRGVEFNKIGDDVKSIGVIAQEIEKILPEVVKEDDKGMKSVAYGNISGLLIEAIKELKAEIEELKKHNCNCNK